MPEQESETASMILHLISRYPCGCPLCVQRQRDKEEGKHVD